MSGDEWRCAPNYSASPIYPREEDCLPRRSTAQAGGEGIEAAYR
jgi:hypothetical protein